MRNGMDSGTSWNGEIQEDHHSISIREDDFIKKSNKPLFPSPLSLIINTTTKENPMRKLIFQTLTENPHFTKGNLIHHLNLPTDNSSLLEISKGIWNYNHKTGRRGGYSLTPTT